MMVTSYGSVEARVWDHPYGLNKIPMCVAESWFMVLASSFILPTLKQIASAWEMPFSGKQSNETSQWQFDLILQASAT